MSAVLPTGMSPVPVLSTSRSPPRAAWGPISTFTPLMHRGCLGGPGDHELHVSSVAFKRKSCHWKLIDNPFPATLHPDSCLAVVIRYKATEKYPRSCDVVLTSDDPATPVRFWKSWQPRSGATARLR